MNLHNQLPSNLYVIDASATDVYATPKSGKFFAITCTVAGSVLTKGGSTFIYCDASELTDANAQTFIDPLTGIPFLLDDDMEAAANGDGFYQSIDTEPRTFVMLAGQTIYGRWDSLKSNGTFTGFAYAG
mgnify:CR=1 FL=1|tara:strand:- start:61 stop:447 length:387 start_codon:yes stop_codon:yes gene_type:complete